MITQTEASERFRQAPDRYIDVSGGALAYYRMGRGPAVLFVHGWPASAATFRRLLPYLCEHVTCHMIDMLGAGQSRFSRDTRIDLARHIEDVRTVADALGLEEFCVVGHDSGGLIARHALAADRRVRGWALVNTEQPQGLNWRFRQFLLMAKLPAFEHGIAWSVMQRGLRKNRYLLGDCFHDVSLLGGEFEEFFLAPLRDDPARRWAAGQFGARFDVGLVSALAEAHAAMRAPVQLVWGEDDPFFPVAWAAQMAESFADGRLKVIPKAKLFVHEERPGEVAAAMLPTLLGER